MYKQAGKAALVEFSYVSKPSEDLPRAVFLRLARQVWSHNTRLGLTGELRFDGARFEQVLEGPPEIMLSLAARILSDPRHGSINIRAFRQIEARSFTTWSMIGFAEDGPAAADFPPTGNLRLFPTLALPQVAPAHGAIAGTT